MSMRSVTWWVIAGGVLVVAGAASAGEGLVALQTAEPACPDDSGDRYVDCGNGTVTDNQTGLVWLANADCVGQMTWHEAVEVVASLADLPDSEVCVAIPDRCDCSLSDGSSPGEWRLPTVGEWKAMIDDADGLGCNPAITADDGTTCWFEGCELPAGGSICSFYSVQGSWYWTASTDVFNPDSAYDVRLHTTVISTVDKVLDHHVWPVRGGQ